MANRETLSVLLLAASMLASTFIATFADAGLSSKRPDTIAGTQPHLLVASALR